MTDLFHEPSPENFFLVFTNMTAKIKFDYCLRCGSQMKCDLLAFNCCELFMPLAAFSWGFNVLTNLNEGVNILRISNHHIYCRYFSSANYLPFNFVCFFITHRSLIFFVFNFFCFYYFNLHIIIHIYGVQCDISIHVCKV